MTYVITQPCIGVKDRSCIDVCPMDCIHGRDEDEMLYIEPEDCIDCGACVPACPVEAIQLVFGSEKRGVEIPRIKHNFESNVPGLYIVGELGGMGLIRNAFEQGRQCVEGIVNETKGAKGTM